MELNEAIHRIVLRHLKLVVACLVAGLALGFAAGSGPPLYSAKARLVLEAPTPKTGAESSGLADSARGIATSYSHVGAAVKAVGVKRDPAFLAAQRITVASVGSSDVLQLTVRDRNPTVASALANALADDVVRTRRETAQGGIPAAVTELDAKIAALVAELAAVDQQIDAANAAIAGSRDSQTLAAGTAAASAERSRRETVSQQLLTVQTARTSLITTDAERPRAAVVDAANTPLNRDPSPILPDTALGGLAGLTLGLGLAALVEAMRPCIVGERSLSRALGAPVLGRLTCCPANLDELDVRSVQTRLRLAANAARVSSAQLVAVAAKDDLEPLAALLQRTKWRDPGWEVLETDGHDRWDQSSVPELEAEPVLVPASPELNQPQSSSTPPAVPRGVRDKRTRAASLDSGRRTFRVRAFNAASANVALPGPNSGFVVVVSEVGRRSDLDSVTDLIAFSRRPLLGIVTYRSRRGCNSHHRSDSPDGHRVESRRFVV